MLLARRMYSLKVWLLWHCVAAAAIVTVPNQLRFGKSVSATPAEHLIFSAELIAAYLGCVIFIAWRTRNGRTVSLTDVALTVLAFFGGCSLVLLVGQAFYSPFILVTAFAACALSIALSFVLPPKVLVPLAIGLGVVTVVLQTLKERPKEFVDFATGAGITKPTKTQAVIGSGLYPIKATFYDHYFDICNPAARKCDPPRNGGGISTFSTGYLLATGEGLLHFFSVDPANGVLNAKQLHQSIPLNSDAYLEQGPKEGLWLFRVMDILVREEGKRFTLFASHHHWNLDMHCFAIRVSKLEGDTDAFLAGTMEGDWQTVFETKPCLPLKSGPRGRPFSGDESGGRMVFLDDRTILLTVGDHQFNGWESTQILAQDDSNDYGKTLTIDLSSGRGDLFTKGHRNPQGLYVAPDKTIWSTEHGPSGGDELNVLVKGKNYGWPLVTYGVEYLRYDWPLNKTPGDHAGFERPMLSWMPSIAVSNLIGVQGTLFPLWKNDLLLCTFITSLLRVRIREGRVAYVEHIEVRQRNGRLRDILEDKDGRIVLWLDRGAVAFLEPISDAATSQGKPVEAADRGQALFSACAPCHKVGDGTLHSVGPDLAGIVGRSIGGAAGFAYSDDMKKQSGEWTEARLDEFLANPQRAVPGTSMRSPGMESPEDRASLISYLKRLKRQ